MAQSEVQEESEKKGLNFVEEEVFNDLKAGKNGGRLSTRFPPEPNGYLHIGHAKAICMDFGIAEKFGGTCNLRFDDTNPVKEDVEYVDAIREDIHWLGFDWGDREYYASDYFPKLYDLAIRLIKEGKAYVDDQSSEEIAAQKGTPTQPGTESPYRNRSVEENLDLFTRMNAGEFEEGSRVLRAKIDMASPNMHFRDPIMYRIIKTPHHRTGTTWKVYPMYRLKGAYIVKCTGVKKDAEGNIEEIYCTYDPDTRSGLPGSSRKVKGTLHWVSAPTAVNATARIYDRLFCVENPAAETERDFREMLNPDSLKVVENIKVEPYLAEIAKPGVPLQFQRIGYFTLDPDSTPGSLIFNRTIALKDSWEKINK